MIIVGTAYNRPEYLFQALEAWAQVDGIGRCKMVWCVDPSDRQSEVTHLLRSFDACPGTYEINRFRLGCQLNTREALRYGFEILGSDYVIAAEDDVLPSGDILLYHEWAAEHLRSAPVMTVCSFAPPRFAVESELHLKDWFSPWLWGTWSDRWFNWLRPMWGHPSYYGFDENIAFNIQPAAGMRSVFPRVSRSLHVGKFGTHTVGVLEKPREFVGVGGRSSAIDTWRL